MKVKKRELRMRLMKLAEQKTKQVEAETAAFMEDQRKRLPDMVPLEADGEFADYLDGQIESVCDCFAGNPLLPPRCYADMLRQFVEYVPSIEIPCYGVKGEIDPSLPDEENLRESSTIIYDAQPDLLAYRRVRTKVEDLMTVFAKVAKNINSPFFPRVLKLLAFIRTLGERYKRRPSHEEAEKFRDEFLECWDLVFADVCLLDECDMAKACPPKPVHELEEEEWNFLGFQPKSNDPKKETERSRMASLEDYRRTHAAIVSKRSPDGDNPPMRALLRQIQWGYRKMKMNKVEIDSVCHWLDYELLEKVIGSDFDFAYWPYVRKGKRKIERGELIRETQVEDEIKSEIIRALMKWFAEASRYAKRIGSSSYADWANCMILMRKYWGRFDVYLNPNAKRDLRTLITTIQSARNQLWVDSKNYEPPKNDPSRVSIANIEPAAENTMVKGMKTRKTTEQRKRSNPAKIPLSPEQKAWRDESKKARAEIKRRYKNRKGSYIEIITKMYKEPTWKSIMTHDGKKPESWKADVTRRKKK